MAVNQLSNPSAQDETVKPQDAAEQVPLQVMVPRAVRRQLAVMGASRGENLRTTVLRALRGLGIDIPDSEFGDRRGRRSPRRNGNGAQ